MNKRSWRVHVEAMRLHLAYLERLPVPVDQMPDAAAIARQIERRLATLRQGWDAEEPAAARDPESKGGPGAAG